MEPQQRGWGEQAEAAVGSVCLVGSLGSDRLPAPLQRGGQAMALLRKGELGPGSPQWGPRETDPNGCPCRWVSEQSAPLALSCGYRSHTWGLGESPGGASPGQGWLPASASLPGSAGRTLPTPKLPTCGISWVGSCTTVPLGCIWASFWLRWHLEGEAGGGIREWLSVGMHPPGLCILGLPGWSAS